MPKDIDVDEGYDGEYDDYLANDDYDDEEDEEDDLDDYDDDDDYDDFDDEEDDFDEYDEGYNGNGDLRGGSSEDLGDAQPEYIH